MTGTRRTTRATTWAIAALAPLIAATGCGIPADKNARTIDAKQVPFGLNDPSTTLSTTTTTTTTTGVPVEPTVIVPSSTTTTIPAPVEYLSLYFARGDRIAEVLRPQQIRPSLNDVIAQLAEGPRPGELADTARTAIEAGDVLDVTLLLGVATVDFAAKFRELPAAEQGRSVAQIVLALTARPGVGQVRFTIEGESFDAPRADGTFAGPTVSREDYLELLEPA